MDSSVGGSSIALPTVVEEVPGPRKSGLEIKNLPQAAESHLGEPPAEMAVRRGKNRFITGQLSALCQFSALCPST